MRGGDEYEGVVIPLSMERLKDAMRGDRLADAQAKRRLQARMARLELLDRLGGGEAA